jgi:hypothetical protein
LKHFKFENARIREFDFECHEQVNYHYYCSFTYTHLGLQSEIV